MEVSVKDCDVGISEEELKAVFDKFTQNKKTGAGGTGLDLAISRQIIKNSYGNPKAINNPENGACFIFPIPKVRENENIGWITEEKASKYAFTYLETDLSIKSFYCLIPVNQAVHLSWSGLPAG